MRAKLTQLMIHYSIKFYLHPDKQNEFSHSWTCFSEHVEETEGLNDCKMTRTEDDVHEILLIWSERYYLNLFMNDEWYKFLHGAVNVLGKNSVITQKEINGKMD
jgi:hypothetical protein